MDFDFYEHEHKGIPFDRVQELFDFLEFGSAYFTYLALIKDTGCRLSEVDNFFMSNYDMESRVLYWHLGKNQRSYRKARLTKKTHESLISFRKENPVPKDRMLPRKAFTFRRNFDLRIRPKLNHHWQEKAKVLTKSGIKKRRVLTLGGFRKNFATILFWKFYKKYNDPSYALDCVKGIMKHHTKYMTENFYIGNANYIQVEKFIEKDVFSRPNGQQKIAEWMIENKPVISGAFS